MTEGQILRHEEERLLRENVEHLHGPEEVPYAEDELMVVCLVRDGRPYIKSFIEHYRSIGAKHIAFLDNNSSDGTIETLKEYDDVTVLRTELPYKEHKNLFKRYLIARFGGEGRWCLCVDMDEFFDYPYSDVVGLGALLRYLSGKSYTAVAAHLLDMFSEEPLSGQADGQDGPLKETHRFYDVSNLKRKSLKGRPALRSNTLGSEEVEFFKGGVRDTVFGSDPLLTKFPLVFLDGKVRPMEDSHHADNAAIADVTGALLHYKFLDSHFHDRVALAIREENYFQNSAKYKMYKEVLDRNPSLRMKLDTARELVSVNDLLEDQFLVVSEDYLNWVNTEDEKKLRAAVPDELVGAVLESRRREREKTLGVQRLEHRLRKTERLARFESKRRDGARGQQAQGLEQRLREEADGQSEENKRLAQRVRSLEEQLEAIRGSRAWRLMEMLHRVKIRVSRLGRGSS